MVPPKPVNGALIPATASQSSSPHPTQEGGRVHGDRAITAEPAAVAVAQGRPRALDDTSAVSTPQITLSGDHSATTQKMLFSDLYKSTKLPLSRLRHHPQPPVTVSQEYDPDLFTKDKAKQREAVRRLLTERIRDDWVFSWPPASEAGAVGESAFKDPTEHVEDALTTTQPTVGKLGTAEEAALGVDEDGYHCDDDEDAASTYSTVSEDLVHFRPRDDWLSDFSDDDNDEPPSPLTYRFETPDAVGSTLKATELARSAKRRRAMRAEAEWNSGLACFTARRDAWTGARVVRIRPKPAESSPVSPTTRRLSFWRLSSSSSPSSPTESPPGSTVGTASLSPSGTRTSGDTSAVSSVDTEPKELKARQGSSQYPVQTLIPIPPPLLPAGNPMRASITPASYGAIYDKITVHAMTPGCPINLADVLRACVVGWKRDGEWPPRAVELPPAIVPRKKKRKESNTEKKPSIARRLSFNFLGARLSVSSDPNSAAASPITKQDDPGAVRGVKKSLQRVLLGLGQQGD